MASQDSRVQTVEVATDIFDTPRQITVSDAYDANADVVLFDGDCSELLKKHSVKFSGFGHHISAIQHREKIREANVLTVISKKSGACNCGIG